MSDVPMSVENTVEIVQPVVESSGAIWGYVAGGVALVIATSIYCYKKVNNPTFVINQLRKKNRKEIKKLGAEDSEFMNDLDRLLDSVLNYANKHNKSSGDILKVISPLNDTSRNKTPRDIYQSMSHVASKIEDTSLARELKGKSSQLKVGSPLMTGLLRRAGI